MVILPIYKDTELTRACIISAMHGILEVPNAKLLMLNDCSPEPDMQAMLLKIVADYGERVHLESNECNLGFVKTVNKGLVLALGGDVVLLNSDVLLPPCWLGRLREEAYSDARVGTVTPLSNNTTICTFPEFLQDNQLPFGLPVRDVDDAFRQGRLPNVEAPTGVGFCMYIRRDCLEAVGPLSEEHFPRGYGEENDFCQRVIKKGWSNLITPNLFAYHKGGVSFGEEKIQLIENACRTIDRLHPNYHFDVQTFIQGDPLKSARLIRLMQLVAVQSVPKILHISHGLGGGTQQHILELAEYFYNNNKAFSLILTATSNSGVYRLTFGHAETADSVMLDLPAQMDLLIDTLKSVGVSLVHIHHVIGLHSSLFSLPRILRVPYYLTVHDYYLLGGNPTLTNENGVYNEANLDCESNSLYPLPAGETLASWRARHRSIVKNAEKVIFPSAAACDIFTRIYPVPRPIVAWHLEQKRNVHNTPGNYVASDKSRIVIGVLGALGKEKGADFLESITAAANDAALPFDFKLLGYAYRPLRGVQTTGPYRSEEILDLIKREGCDLLLYPALCPETYSYTLSIGLESRLPIVAPQLGAFPERLGGRQQVLLYQHGTAPHAVLKQMENFVAALRAGKQLVAPAWNGDPVDQAFYTERYLLNVGATVLVDENKSLDNHRRVVRALLEKPTLPVDQWPHEIWNVLIRMYRLPGVLWLRNLMPGRLKKFLKNFIVKRYNRRLQKLSAT